MIKKRTIAEDIIDGLIEIKEGRGQFYSVGVANGVKLIRIRTRLSQSQFARCLNISLRTVQEWEQGRKHPKGPALALLNIINKHPDILSAHDPNHIIIHCQQHKAP